MTPVVHTRPCTCHCGCRRLAIVRPPSIWSVCRDCIGHLIGSAMPRPAPKGVA